MTTDTQRARWRQGAWTSLALGLLALGVCVVKYGIGVFPSWAHLFDIGQHWSDPNAAPLMVPPADYLLTNFPAAWLGGVLGMSTPSKYFMFNLALSLVALAVPFLFGSIRATRMGPRYLFMFTVGGPISILLLSWVGGYDAISVIGLGIAVLARNRIVGAAGWFLVALNHPVLAVAALVLWLPMMWLVNDRRMRLSPVVVGAAGTIAVGAGYLANRLITDSWGGTTSRWDWLQDRGFDEFLSQYIAGLPYVFFAAMGGFWLVVLNPSLRSRLTSRLLMIEAVIACVLLPLISLDSSRIIGLALYAVTLTWILGVVRSSDEDVLVGGWSWTALACAIIPVPLMWDGDLLYPGWSSFSDISTQLTPPEGYIVQ
ncbi:MAG: hypothetical protein PSX37_00270 [bacterium]|nr:hypothetical protein [bacterium]